MSSSQDTTASQRRLFVSAWALLVGVSALIAWEMTQASTMDRRTPQSPIIPVMLWVLTGGLAVLGVWLYVRGLPAGSLRPGLTPALPDDDVSDPTPNEESLLQHAASAPMFTHCPSCGYDFTGAPTAICPECGLNTAEIEIPVLHFANGWDSLNPQLSPPARSSYPAWLSVVCTALVSVFVGAGISTGALVYPPLMLVGTTIAAVLFMVLIARIRGLSPVVRWSLWIPSMAIIALSIAAAWFL